MADVPIAAEILPSVASPAPIAQPIDIAPDTIATTDSAGGEDASGALLAGGAVLGLGLIGFVALRRRKTGARKQPAPQVVRPRVAPQPVPVAQAPVAVPAAQPFGSVASYQRPPVGTIAASHGVVPLPRAMPDRFEDREALIKRMVSARPDRANPFRSGKARRHRAKLILQSLTNDFADREPLIDLSDYPGNWPLVANRRYATAA